MNKLRKYLANTFIVFLLLTMAKPHLPLEAKFLSTIYYPINKLEGLIGTNQKWNMFSPNPTRLDAYVLGQVEYDDGSSDSYDFNKPIGLNIFQKYLYGEKYRKFVSEHLRTDNKSFLWADGAQFVVTKLEAKNSNKKPTKVTLTRFWSETPNWNKHFMKHGEAKPQYNSFVFFTKENF